MYKRQLGVYALDEIWNGQELLLANREYPMEGEATAREDISEVIEDGMEDEGVLGADDGTGEAAQEAPSGHQYATCDDTGGWRMHEPLHPWTDGTLLQQHTPPPVSNIPRWTNLTAEYQDIEIPIAEASALRKDLWLTSLNCGSLSAANSQTQINKAKLSSKYWQFQRCGSDVMYLTDTRLTQMQGQRACLLYTSPSPRD